MIENSKKPIPVLVSGALGKMGSEVVNTVLNSTDCELVAAIDINEKNNGSNISELLKVVCLTISTLNLGNLLHRILFSFLLNLQ